MHSFKGKHFKIDSKMFISENVGNMIQNTDTRLLKIIPATVNLFLSFSNSNKYFILKHCISQGDIE